MTGPQTLPTGEAWRSHLGELFGGTGFRVTLLGSVSGWFSISTHVCIHVSRQQKDLHTLTKVISGYFISALFIVARAENFPSSHTGEMDKENVVYLCLGVRAAETRRPSATHGEKDESHPMSSKRQQM